MSRRAEQGPTDVTATYTYDVFSSLDGFGSYAPPGNWGGYWGKQGPELLARREVLYETGSQMVLGATTFGDFERMWAHADRFGLRGTWVERMRELPMTVVSSTLSEPLDWPDAHVVDPAAAGPSGAAEVVAELKRTSELPLVSHGSLTLNRALLAAGLVDLVRITTFPVIAGQTGDLPVLVGQTDFDLDLVESRVLDARTIEAIYRPTRREWT